MKKLSEIISVVSLLNLVMLSGIGPRNLFLLKFRRVSSVKLPMLLVRNPSYPAPSSSRVVIRLLELSSGMVHKIPRKWDPVLSHGSTEKSHVLMNELEGIEFGSIPSFKARRTSISELSVAE